MSDLTDLYQELIVDHSKNPRNFHAIDGCSHHAEGRNPLCGDELELYVQVDGDTIADIAFKGSGCAISTASASLMTGALKGKTVADATALFAQVRDMLTTDAEADLEAMGKLAALSGVREFPVRVKCATLAWRTFEAAVAQSQGVVTTDGKGGD